MTTLFLGYDPMLKPLSIAFLSIATLAIAGSSIAQPDEPSLNELRAATEKFQDVNVALAEGYVRDPHNICLTADMMGRPTAAGAMGIHFFRPDLLGIDATTPRVDGTGMHTDFTRPSVLIYAPQPDGKLKLVAIENLVFEKALRGRGENVPSFAGHRYNYMADDPATPVDEAHGFAPHYDLHIWLYEKNPAGDFASFNRAVKCPAPKDHDQ
jgi:hypothetical protein